MTAAITTASASIVVAVLAFLLNQRAQIRQERRQARITRINSQLRELYGPLNTLVSSNERVWDALRASFVPDKDARDPAAESGEWQKWRDQVLIPTNHRMRDLIIQHADLIDEAVMPLPLRDFCAHVLALDISAMEEREGSPRSALIAHPGKDFTAYIEASFSRLKSEQNRLLGMSL
ncbi:hypothetical protein [Streptomyces sp. NPDC001568]|uniref:hypothetical protein n=1 Tax=Streptomyces sp. NPDC001568 TaxID=3364588 RepID=UPI003685A1A2